MTRILGNTREARTLKEALYNTVHHHPTLSVAAIAEELQMSASYLYRAVSPDKDTDGETATGVNYPSKKIVPLVRLTQDYQALDFMERSLGRVAVSVPSTSSAAIKELCQCAMKAGAEFGDLLRAVDEAMEDGKVSPREMDRISKEGWEAIEAIMAVIVRCEQL